MEGFFKAMSETTPVTISSSVRSDEGPIDVEKLRETLEYKDLLFRPTGAIWCCSARKGVG